MVLLPSYLDRSFVITPKVTSLSSATGSTNGGLVLVIEGSGFIGKTFPVSLSLHVCKHALVAFLFLI